MLIKNSKVLTIGGKWLHPSGESPIPPGPGPTGTWEQRGGYVYPDTEAYNNRNLTVTNYAGYEIYNDETPSVPQYWFDDIDTVGFRTAPNTGKTDVGVAGLGRFGIRITNSDISYGLIDFISMYYCECSDPSDYYYPSNGQIRLYLPERNTLSNSLRINIDYATTSTTGLSPIGKTQNDTNVITVTNNRDTSKTFQVKIGTMYPLDKCACISNFKFLIDDVNHKLYAICRPVPTTPTYDPTDFTNLKWHLIAEDFYWDPQGVTTRYSYGLLTQYYIDRCTRTTTAGDDHWIVTGLQINKRPEVWKYTGDPFYVPIDNEAYHDYT